MKAPFKSCQVNSQCIDMEEIELNKWDEKYLKQLIEKHSLHDLKCIDVHKNPYCLVKRGMDIILSGLGIAVLLVPALIVALLLYIDGTKRVLFRQYRVGKDGKRFRIYKFRSMREDTPKYLSTEDVVNPERYITRIGRIIRKFSIDEIPQLLNVLIGNMSLVGPRPLISDERDIHILRKYFGVYSVRPGITGLAQINGRDQVTLSEKVHWDVEYLNNFGFWNDLKIFLFTIPKAIGGVGIVEGKKTKKREVA